MNERIKEIERWCFKEIPVGLNGKFIAMEFDRQKFAEMIIRECADFLDYRLTNPDGASMAWCDGSDIKEHFGVKE